jgi:peptidoglycan/xylan/chitin deacetylase (PgdA/CDA1 family)
MSLRGVFYVIAGFVGREVNGFRFVEWDALRQMSAESHEIGSHSFTHRVSTTGMTAKAAQLLRLVRNRGLVQSAQRFTDTVLRSTDEYPVPHLPEEEELGRSKLEIEKELGRQCNSYSYPGGQMTSTLMSLVKDTGYTSARTSRIGFNSTELPERYALRTQVWDRWVTPRIAEKWVDRAIDNNLWLIEVFHAIDLPEYLYSCSESALNGHLSYIRSKNGEIDNLTVCEAIEKIHQRSADASRLQTVS